MNALNSLEEIFSYDRSSCRGQSVKMSPFHSICFQRENPKEANSQEMISVCLLEILLSCRATRGLSTSRVFVLFPSECSLSSPLLSPYIMKWSSNGFQKEIMTCNYCHNYFLPNNLLICNISTTEKFNQGNFSKVIPSQYLCDIKANNQFLEFRI